MHLGACNSMTLIWFGRLSAYLIAMCDVWMNKDEWDVIEFCPYKRWMLRAGRVMVCPHDFLDAPIISFFLIYVKEQRKNRRFFLCSFTYIRKNRIYPNQGITLLQGARAHIG